MGWGKNPILHSYLDLTIIIMSLLLALVNCDIDLTAGKVGIQTWTLSFPNTANLLHHSLKSLKNNNIY